MPAIKSAEIAKGFRVTQTHRAGRRGGTAAPLVTATSSQHTGLKCSAVFSPLIRWRVAARSHDDAAKLPCRLAPGLAAMPHRPIAWHQSGAATGAEALGRGTRCPRGRHRRHTGPAAAVDSLGAARAPRRSDTVCSESQHPSARVCAPVCCWPAQIRGLRRFFQLLHGCMMPSAHVS